MVIYEKNSITDHPIRPKEKNGIYCRAAPGGQDMDR